MSGAGLGGGLAAGRRGAGCGAVDRSPFKTGQYFPTLGQCMFHKPGKCVVSGIILRILPRSRDSTETETFTAYTNHMYS